MCQSGPVLTSIRSPAGSALTIVDTTYMSCNLIAMTHDNDPIANVSVLSTGSVRIRPEHVGPTRKNTYVWLATSRRWTAPRPINVYVIEHRDGLVLFDTGQDRASVTDPDYFPGGVNGVIYDRLARFEIGPEETLSRGLATLGHRPSDTHRGRLAPAPGPHGWPARAGRSRDRRQRGGVAVDAAAVRRGAGLPARPHRAARAPVAPGDAGAAGRRGTVRRRPRPLRRRQSRAAAHPRAHPRISEEHTPELQS